MNTIKCVFLIWATLLTIAATCPCSDAQTSPTKTEETKTQRAEATAALAAETKEIFRAHCAECHAGDNARSGVEVLNHQHLLDDEYVSPGKPDDSYLYLLITSTDDDVMPPQDRPALTAAQIDTIRKWIVAGAAAFPQDIKLPGKLPEPTTEPDQKPTVSPDTQTAHSSDDPQADLTKPETETTEAVLNDRLNDPPKDLPANEPTEAQSATTSVAEKTPAADTLQAREADILKIILNRVRDASEAERPFLRFFSIRHLLNQGVTLPRVEDHRLALAKAINHLSREPQLVTPEPLDEVAGGTVFAVDIRKLGWHRTAVADPSNPQRALDFFDLALLEYPYAALPETSDTYDRLEREFLRDAQQVRPIPYVRGDWFCSAVLLPPLYHDFLQMPRTIDELEMNIGVNVESNLDTSIAQRAGMTVSGISRNNRAVERHPHSNGYYWKSHDFSNNIGAENILKDPIHFVPGGGEMFFTLPNGLNAYYVTDGRGDRIDAAPTSIVVDKFASDRTVRNGLGCIRCHNKGIKDFRDVVRPIVEQLPSSPGFDKRKTLELYPSGETWKKIVKTDQEQFIAAIERIGISANRREPVTSVTAAYLEDAINVAQAAAEIGTTAAELKSMCRSRGMLQLGLAPLAAGSVIRRDAFEDNFGTAVRALGIGVPVIPLDGNTRHRFALEDADDSIAFHTNKPSNFFEPGDRLRVFVQNKSAQPMVIELYGTSIDGRKVCLTDGQVTLSPAETFSFPPKGKNGIEVRGGLGRESITLYASNEAMPIGVVMKGKNLDDRVVHEFYGLRNFGESAVIGDPENVIKKTIFIETR